MQDVTNSFLLYTIGRNRKVRARLLVSWLKTLGSNTFFTIGVSTIGGADVIKGSGNNITEFDQYNYEEESDYVTDIAIERKITEPIFSAARAIADIELDNNSGRFSPDGDSDIADYILPRRPLRIYLGFDRNYQEMVQVFVGQLSSYPEVEKHNRLIKLRATDFAQSIWDYPLDQAALYIDQRSDQIIEDLLTTELGMSGDNFVLDEGANTIGYAYFEKGTKLGNVIEKLCQAELARFYCDEQGTFRFENFVHWNSAPYNIPVMTIDDSLVINEKQPSVNNVINVVEILGKPREVQPNQVIYALSGGQEIKGSSTVEFFVNLDDPVTGVDNPLAYGSHSTSYYRANTAFDGSGSDMTSLVSVAITTFSKSVKVTATNSSGVTVYLTELVLWGTPAKSIFGEDGLYLRNQDDTSVETYDEHPVRIDNDYIQTESYARGIASIIISSRKDPFGYLELTVRGQPQLQLGDLVIRNSNEYTIFGLKTRLNADVGLIQELALAKRTIVSYFTIGVSSIGSSTDLIAL